MSWEIAHLRLYFARHDARLSQDFTGCMNEADGILYSLKTWDYSLPFLKAFHWFLSNVELLGRSIVLTAYVVNSEGFDAEFALFLRLFHRLMLLNLKQTFCYEVCCYWIDKFFRLLHDFITAAATESTMSNIALNSLFSAAYDADLASASDIAIRVNATHLCVKFQLNVRPSKHGLERLVT